MGVSELQAYLSSYQAAVDAGDYIAARKQLAKMAGELAATPDMQRSANGLRWRQMIKDCREALNDLESSTAAGANRNKIQTQRIQINPISGGDF